MYPYLFSLLLLVSSAIGCDSREDPKHPNNHDGFGPPSGQIEHGLPTILSYQDAQAQHSLIAYTEPVPQDATRQQLTPRQIKAITDAPDPLLFGEEPKVQYVNGQGLTITKVPNQPILVNGGVAPEIPHKTEGDALIPSIRELTPKQVTQLVSSKEANDPWAYQIASPIKDELPEDAFIRYRNQVISCGEILLGQTNQLRTRKSLKPFALDTNLQKHATQWSVHMANSAGLQHGDVNVQGTAGGQNIAEGQTTATEVMASWISSPGHYANIVNSNYTKVGFGWAYNPKGVIYWTCNFSN